MKIKICSYIAEFLRMQKIEYVFEMAGGMITQILDEIHKLGATKIVSVHHEQAAAFAADAYGRCTGKPGVALATSGPGATNLITGIGSCYFDSSPALFITGQVNTHEQKGTRDIRQLGFQETDIVSMTQHITKKSYRITEENVLGFRSLLKEAYEIAVGGRPGPVLIDLPMNLQRFEIEREKEYPFLNSPLSNQTSNQTDKMLVEQMILALKKSKRPLILAGGGIHAARQTKEFLCLIERMQIPVVTSLLAVDVMPYAHPLRAGFIGSYGNRWANIAIGISDLLIVVGSRLDIRQTGADVKSFSQNKQIFHIDCEAGEINNRLSGCVPFLIDIADFIPLMQLNLAEHPLPEYSAWLKEINELCRSYPDTEELKNIKGINPNYFMHALSQHSNQGAGYVVDVGNHQMWAAQSLEIRPMQFFMTSGGMGAMGFALPAAIGASLAHQKKPVTVIVGDGSMQLNLQELQTIVRNKIPIKIIVLNNNSLGMIRQFQDSYFEGRYQSTYWGYSAPNFEKIAHAYGLQSKTISSKDKIQAGISWLWEKEEEACLLQVMIDYATNVYPKIAFGKPITEMEPIAQPTAMEST